MRTQRTPRWPGATARWLLSVFLLGALRTLPSAVCSPNPQRLLRRLQSGATTTSSQPQYNAASSTAASRQSLLFGNRSAGWYAVGLLPQPLDLSPDKFGTTYDPTGRSLRCDQRTILAASVQTFNLPTTAESFTLVAVLEPPRRDPAALQGDLLTAGGLRLQWDVGANVVRIFALWDSSALMSVGIPTGAGASSVSWPYLTLSLSRRADGALGVCFNGVPASIPLVRPPGVRQLPGGWLNGSSLGARWSLAAADKVQLGDSRATTSLGTRLQQVWLVNTAWNCTDVASMMSNTSAAMPAGSPSRSVPGSSGGAAGPPPARPRPASASPSAAAGTTASTPPRLGSLIYSNTLPVVTYMHVSVSGGGTGADGEAFVGQDVTVEGQVYDADSDALRVRLTWYGVPARSCLVASCGDEGLEIAGAGSATVSQTVTFKVPGLFTVRLEASDLTGTTVAQDVRVLVRKIGDTNRQAPCCRSTGMVIASQAGRPVHSTRFRDLQTSSLALGLGWPADYLAAEELEVERLFDYGMLAPLHDPVGLQVSTCVDAFLAGPGSPRVLSGSLDQRAVTTGHGKRLLVVPQGFSWGASVAGNQTESPVCESHWTHWAADSPYRVASGNLPNGSRAFCSFACTPSGTRTLQQLTGLTDRLAEAMAELSYGRLSLSWDLDVTNTLLLPQNTTMDAFAYSDSPVGPFLTASGIDRSSYHTVVVLSPAPPRRINPGYTAWSAVGAGTMFIMRCVPQLYYLVHEMGHLLGLPHADMWRLDNATVAPSDPAGQGLPQDFYSDKLDMMACCRGDYGALSRIWLGWMPYPERIHIPLPITPPAPPPPRPPGPVGRAPSSGSPPLSPPPAPSAGVGAGADSLLGDCDPGLGSSGCSYTLWPVDRAESRGRLKALSIRISDSQLVILSYKALPWWQDMRLGRDFWNVSDRDNVIADEMRPTLTGLSVEYMKKMLDNNTGTTSFSGRGLLDFNVLFGEWPSNLPPAPASLPPPPTKSAFALLKEGQAWLHSGGRLLVVAQQEVDCDGQSELSVYNYTVPNFYGFRGESPGGEGFRRSDYTGYAGGLRCLRVAVRTQMPSQAKPGKLAVRLRVLGSDSSRPHDLRGTCGFSLLPKLQLVLPSDPTGRKQDNATADAPPPSSTANAADAAGALPAGIAAVVWKDPRNATFASGTMVAVLPPFSDGWLREASANDSPPCVYGCDSSYRVRIAAYDGAQTLVSVRIVQVSLRHVLLHVSYRYYQLDQITTESEVVYVPVVAPWVQAAVPAGSPQGDAADGSWTVAAAWGLQLLGDASGSRRIDEQPAVAWSAERLPDTACSRQFTLTMLLKLREPSGRSDRWPLAAIQLAPFAAGGGGASGAPYEGPKLWIQWNSSAATPATFTTTAANSGDTSAAAPLLTLAVTLDPNRQATVAMGLPPPRDERMYHVVVVYDKGRVGVFVDGGGGRPWRDAGCVPPRANVTYCAAAHRGGGATAPDEFVGSEEAPLRGISLLGGSPGLDATLMSARIYNYALPRADLTAESTCLLEPEHNCGSSFGLRAPSSSVLRPAVAATVATPAAPPPPTTAPITLTTTPAGTVVLPISGDQRGDWDLLAATAAAATTVNANGSAFLPGTTPRTRYKLQVGNWSSCSAACGGGVSLRSVICLRAASRGPWAVGLDDCPLASLPATVTVCNSQPCPSRWVALTPAPGPDGCLQQPGCSAPAFADSATIVTQAVAGGGQAIASRRLQPTCLQSGGVQLRLGACVIEEAAASSLVAPAPAPAPAPNAMPIPSNVSNTTDNYSASQGGTWLGLTLLVNVSNAATSGLQQSSKEDNTGTGSGANPVPAPSHPPQQVRVSLRQAVLQDALKQACPVAENGTVAASASSSCDSALTWQYGVWGPCLVDCSGSAATVGGVRVRTVTCVNGTTKEWLDAAACTAALGSPPATALRAACRGGDRTCGVSVLRVGPWSDCDARGSVMGNGMAQRTASCVVARAGAEVQAQCGSGDADSSDLTTVAGPAGKDTGLSSWPLALSTACKRTTPFAAVCMVPALAGSQAACFGNGACSYAGCICNQGYGGQMCEVYLGTQSAGPSTLSSPSPSPTPWQAGSAPAPVASGSSPSTGSLLQSGSTLASLGSGSGGSGCRSGIVDQQERCCASGLLATDGTCCNGAADGAATAGVRPSLDGKGLCCYKAVDACGVCGGSGVAVDVQGACCTAVLDQYGVCCTSGRTDECGVCDGDGTTCVVRLQLRLQLQPLHYGNASNGAGDATATSNYNASSSGSPALVETAVASLQRLLRLALGPTQGSLSISQAGAAGPTAGPEGQAWFAVTYDVVYDDNGGASAGFDGALGTVGAGVLGPLGPYNFTTAAIGLRLEGMRDALQEMLVPDGSAASPLPSAPAIKLGMGAAAFKPQAGKASSDDAGVASAPVSLGFDPQFRSGSSKESAVQGKGSAAPSGAGTQLQQPQFGTVDGALAASGAFRLRQQQPISGEDKLQQQPHAEVQHLVWIARRGDGDAPGVQVGQRRDLLAADPPPSTARTTPSPSPSPKLSPSPSPTVATHPSPSPQLGPTPQLGLSPSIRPGPFQGTSNMGPSPSANPAPAQLVSQEDMLPVERWGTAQALLRMQEARSIALALGLLTVELHGIERLGICGNGVCEVGEQLWPGTESAVVLGRIGACPQDCPLAVQGCPAGRVAGDGGDGARDDVRQCSGRGVCLMGSGACSCFEGYTGDGCELCAPGFQRSLYGDAAGTCVRQYIRGRTVLDWDTVSASRQRSDSLLKNMVLMACLVAGSVLLLTLTALSTAAWLQRRRQEISELASSKADSAAAVPSEYPPISVENSGAPGGRARRSPSGGAASPRRGSRAGRSPSHGAGADTDRDATAGVMAPLVPSRRRLAMVTVNATGEESIDWMRAGEPKQQPTPTASGPQKSRSQSAPTNYFAPAKTGQAGTARATVGKGPSTSSTAAGAGHAEGAVPWSTHAREHSEEGAGPSIVPGPAPRHGAAHTHLRTSAGGAHSRAAATGERTPRQLRDEELSAGRRRVPSQSQDPRRKQQQQQHEEPGRRRAPLGEAVETRILGAVSVELIPGAAQRCGASQVPNPPGSAAAVAGSGWGWGAFLRQLVGGTWPSTVSDIGRLAKPLTSSDGTGTGPSSVKIARWGGASSGGNVVGAATDTLELTLEETQPRRSREELCDRRVVLLGGVEDAAAVQCAILAATVGQEHRTVIAVGDMDGRPLSRTPSPSRRAGGLRAAQLSWGGGDGGSEVPALPVWHADAAEPAALAASPATPTFWRTPPPSSLLSTKSHNEPRSGLAPEGVQEAAAAAVAGPFVEHAGYASQSAAAPVEMKAVDLTPRNLAPAMFAAAQPWSPVAPARPATGLSRGTRPVPMSASASTPSSSSWRWWSPATLGSSGCGASAGGADGGEGLRACFEEDTDEAMTTVSTPLLSSAGALYMPSYTASTPGAATPNTGLTVAARRNRAGSTSGSAGGAAASPHGVRVATSAGAGCPSPLSPAAAAAVSAASPRITIVRNHEGAGGAAGCMGDAAVVKSPRRALLLSRTHATKHD